MNNLNFNDFMWNTMASEPTARVKGRLSKRCNSVASVRSLDKIETPGVMTRSKSLVAISSLSLASLDTSSAQKLVAAARAAVAEGRQAPQSKCINGCGTPPTSKEDKSSSSDKSSKADDADFDEDDDFITDRFNDDCGAILSTPALLLPNYYLEKVRVIFAVFARLQIEVSFVSADVLQFPSAWLGSRVH